MLGGLIFECDDCGAIILPPEHTHEKAIGWWNKRASDAAAEISEAVSIEGITP